MHQEVFIVINIFMPNILFIIVKHVLFEIRELRNLKYDIFSFLNSLELWILKKPENRTIKHWLVGSLINNYYKSTINVSLCNFSYRGGYKSESCLLLNYTGIRFIAQDAKETKIIIITSCIVNSTYTISYLMGVLVRPVLTRLDHHSRAALVNRKGGGGLPISGLWRWSLLEEILTLRFLLNQRMR